MLWLFCFENDIARIVKMRGTVPVKIVAAIEARKDCYEKNLSALTSDERD